jgi:hypothetical protein
MSYKFELNSTSSTTIQIVDDVSNDHDGFFVADSFASYAEVNCRQMTANTFLQLDRFLIIPPMALRCISPATTILSRPIQQTLSYDPVRSPLETLLRVQLAILTFLAFFLRQVG